MFQVSSSHKWAVVPYTKKERYDILNVRESAHTAMVHLFGVKYQDIDTGKFYKDKLKTISSDCLANIFTDDYEGADAYTLYARRCRAYSPPRFIPKDNDFDEECRRDEEKKRQQQEEIKKQELEVLRLRDKVAKMEEAYQKRVEETRKIIEVREKMVGGNNGQYIITSSGKRRVA